jgi:hypothetical protein
MIARKTWFFSASVAEERWAQVTVRRVVSTFCCISQLFLQLHLQAARILLVTRTFGDHGSAAGAGELCVGGVLRLLHIV